MYELEISGLGQDYKTKTGNIQKTFATLANKMADDVYAGGVIFTLKKGGKEATLTLNTRRIRLFKHNPDTRLLTETYLLDQIK